MGRLEKDIEEGAVGPTAEGSPSWLTGRQRREKRDGEEEERCAREGILGQKGKEMDFPNKQTNTFACF